MRSEAETDPEDPSLEACWTANCVSIRAMVAWTSGTTNDRLINVSKYNEEDWDTINSHSGRASCFVNVNGNGRSSIVRTVS